MSGNSEAFKDFIAGQNQDNNPDFVAGIKNGVTVKTKLPNGLSTVKISLTSAQIKTGNSVKILAIAPPPAGYAISVQDQLVNFKYKSVTFDNGNDLILITDTCSSPQYIAAGVIASTNSVFQKGCVDTSMIRNNNMILSAKGLYIQIDADSTVGDGTADVYISYNIVQL